MAIQHKQDNETDLKTLSEQQEQKRKERMTKDVITGNTRATMLVQDHLQKIEDKMYENIVNDPKNKLTEKQQEVWATELVQRLLKKIPENDPFPKEVQLKYDEDGDNTSDEEKNKKMEQFKIIALMELMKSAEIDIPQDIIDNYVAKHGADVYNYNNFKDEVIDKAKKNYKKQCTKNGQSIDEDLIVALDKNEKEISELEKEEQCEEFVKSHKGRYAKNLLKVLEGTKENENDKTKDDKQTDLIGKDKQKTIELIEQDKLGSMLVNTVLYPGLYLPAVLPVLNLIPFVGPLVSLYAMMKILPLEGKHVHLTKKVERAIGNIAKQAFNAKMLEKNNKLDMRMSDRIGQVFDSKMLPKNKFMAQMSEIQNSVPKDDPKKDGTRDKQSIQAIKQGDKIRKENEGLVLDLMKNDGLELDITQNTKQNDELDLTIRKNKYAGLQKPISQNTMITKAEQGENISVNDMTIEIVNEAEGIIKQQGLAQQRQTGNALSPL